ncbi:hypothetical protein [Nevskia sp.]|uniref:hypothetical protein n=1 Tax=Nevskia sp. TaxID=1929292 RepID=UPI0025FDBF0B|nr:hypothetical protein [Nevskia sp.]
MNPIHIPRLLLLTAAFAVGGARAAEVQDLDPRRIDLDGDGVVTAAEVERASAAQFRAMDGNADGQLSQAEFIDARLKLMQGFDSNRDGVVERAELRGLLFKRPG